MGDSSMSTANRGGDFGEHSGQQREAHMIPGVDGKLSFGFPKKIITTLRYSQTFTLTSASGVIVTQIFRMNGMDDPDLTGVGHQPMFWDQFVPVYDSYRVLGSRLTAEFAPREVAGAFGPWNIGINGSTSSSSQGSDPNSRMEASDAVSDVLPLNDGSRKLFLTYAPEINLGRPQGDDTVGALTSTNPTQQYFAHIWHRDIRGPTTSVIDVQVQVEYNVEFFGLKIPLSS